MSFAEHHPRGFPVRFVSHGVVRRGAETALNFLCDNGFWVRLCVYMCMRHGQSVQDTAWAKVDHRSALSRMPKGVSGTDAISVHSVHSEK